MTTNLDDIAKGYNDARKGKSPQRPASSDYMTGYNRAKARQRHYADRFNHAHAAGGKS